MLHIGKNIEFLRNLKGIPQKAMAADLGISQQDYDRIEDQESVDEELLVRIAEILDYPLETFRQSDLNNKINMVFQQSGNQGPVNFNFNPIEFVTNLLTGMIREKDQKLEEMSAEIHALRSILKTKD